VSGLVHQASPADLQSLADATAQKTIEKFFLPFGVDVNDAASMKAFGQDLGYLRGLRELQEARERGRDQGRHAIYVVVGTGVLGALGWILTHLPWPWTTTTPPGH
jgi:hypothetical protein